MFYQHALTLIPAWISNHVSSKIVDEIIYSFPNFNGASLGMDKWFYPILYDGCTYLSLLGLKWNHVSIRSATMQSMDGKMQGTSLVSERRGSVFNSLRPSDAYMRQ